LTFRIKTSSLNFVGIYYWKTFNSRISNLFVENIRLKNRALIVPYFSKAILMKLVLLLSFFTVTGLLAQNKNNDLPIGRYETVLSQTKSKWSQGDIILIDANHYKITSNEEVGEYKFSATAQRVFFVSGPLKTAFAKTILNTNRPTIILPVAENEQQGLKLATADVIAYFKK
jgi:hypothetical protein